MESRANTRAVHRCRFVPYVPSAIQCLAVAPISSPSTPASPNSSHVRSYVAIGRADGHLEFWEWNQKTFCICRMRRFCAGKHSVMSLAYAGNGEKHRLFSAGFASDITEWDPISMRALVCYLFDDEVA